MMTRLEAENAVIGSLLIDPCVLPILEASLTPEDFSMELHRQIYRAALELDRQGQPVDPVLIQQELGGEAALTSEYMLGLMDTTPTAANVEEYIRLTLEASRRRSVAALCHQAAQRAESMDSPEDILAELASSADQLLQSGTRKDLMSTTDCIMSFYDHRMAVDNDPDKAYVSTGYSQLNGVLAGGMINSGLYVMAARPGVGKTTMALNIAENVAKQGNVLFISLEMDANQLTAKRIARVSSIPYNRLMMGQLSEAEYTKLSETTETLSKSKLHVNVRPGLNMEDIIALTRKVKDLRLIVIDYFGLIQPGHKSSANRVEYTTEISGKVKQLARKLGIPVLLLAQLNREVEKRAEKRPQLSDLRDTGALEQDADAVIFLHRPSYYGDRSRLKPWDPEELEVIVAKNRHGATGECKMACFMGLSKIQGGAMSPRDEYRTGMKNEY